MCLSNGQVMRPIRDTMVVSPPLVITDGEIDEMVQKMRKVLDLTWEKVS